jgi:GTP-binding protein HflX
MTNPTVGGRRRRRLTATVTDLAVVRQRAFLVGIKLSGTGESEARRSLEELGLLTETAGSEVVDSQLIRRGTPDPATFVGRGKTEELAAVTRGLDIDVVVLDNDLTPAQQRNLQQAFGCDVVDREAVILDIFAQHATSKAGSLQVELALLRYRLPRLRGRGLELSQQGAGIGTRGPGETKLETDRRRIEQRIARLERELGDLRRIRLTQRKARTRSQVSQVALVGYTNAGKSTLLNRLTDAGVLTEDRMFSTLDSIVRKYVLPDGRAILLSDTVGFIRHLPHHLVEAFRSTLDEVAQADPDPQRQLDAVREVLAEIGADRVPELLVMNKIDAAEPGAMRRLQSIYPEAVCLSALTGEGLNALAVELDERLRSDLATLRLEIPYNRSDVVAAAHREGEVLVEKHDDRGAVLEVRLPRGRLAPFVPFIAS